MMSSLSSYLNLQVLSPYPNLNTGNLASNIAIPLLCKIPIIGPVFFNESGFFYFMIVLVGLISFGLFKTRWGLRVRAVGEHPKAAESVGINVIRTRYINVVLGGAIAGVGGVAFMSSQGAFQVGYTSGLGYVALAVLGAQLADVQHPNLHRDPGHVPLLDHHRGRRGPGWPGPPARRRRPTVQTRLAARTRSAYHYRGRVHGRHQRIVN
jgi:hypothetical protein